jgi:putative transcriptional regulator
MTLEQYYDMTSVPPITEQDIREAGTGAPLFLLSEPFMEDTYFRHSVIMLYGVKEDTKEVMGLSVGARPNLEYRVSKLFSEFEHTEQDVPLYIGGPVAHDELQYLHTYVGITGGRELLPGLQMGGDIDRIRVAMLRDDSVVFHARFFVGHCVWTIEQLLSEVNEEKSWIVVKRPPLSVPQMIFPPYDAWHDVLTGMGGKYAVQAEFPSNTHWN